MLTTVSAEKLHHRPPIILNADPTRGVENVGVWVESKCMQFVAAGRYTRKWLKLYQTIRNLTFGDMGILLVVM